MKKSFIAALAIAGSATVFCATGVSAQDFDFSGVFQYDNDVVRLNFTVGQDSTITIFSSSWDDGGFDPILAIWNGAGEYVSEQDDGGNIGSTSSNGTPYDHGYWDSYYDVFLAAGTYTATIAQYSNFRIGDKLALGFQYDNNPDFTKDLGYGSQPYFNGVWANNGNDPRTGNWAFHILNVEQASQQTEVPEPATMLLLGTGLAGLVGGRMRRNKTL